MGAGLLVSTADCPTRPHLGGPHTQGASTDARVYVTLYSAHEEGLNTGELRLLDKDTLGKPFGRDALDLFVVRMEGLSR